MSWPELSILSRWWLRRHARTSGLVGVGWGSPVAGGAGAGQGWWTGGVTEKVTPDKAVEAMSKFGGTVLKTSLSKEGEKDLQDALNGTSAA